ncbi:MAG: nickel-dependent hydrogenase large subunit [Burkholderiales bacterium]|nr:nickel-dependent hydrogenase large subunit [Burkholderiales bacterium]
MNPGGEILVRAAWDGSRVTGVEIASRRPRVANRLLAGRTVDEAVAMVPRLFSLCGRSQAVAAALACEAAAGQVHDARILSEREGAVRSEAVQEVLRRMLLDWPRLAGMAPDAAALGDARRALTGDAVRAIVKARIVGAGSDWAVLDDAASGDRWLEAAATPVAALIRRSAAERPALAASEVALLPADGEAVARAIGVALAADAAFERAPSWRGAPAETGALARMRMQPWVAAVAARSGRSALARLAARGAELGAQVRPDAPPRARVAGAVPIAPGAGLGWVETARGLLVHAVEIAAGTVRRYRIVAPTEWNFHPRGALAAGLAGVAAAGEGELRRLVHLAVESLDPCVAYRVEVSQA